MIFDSHVQNIPCQIEIIHDDDLGIDFFVLDDKNRHAEWLERKVTASDEQRIREEYLAACAAERFDAEYCLAEARALEA